MCEPPPRPCPLFPAHSQPSQEHPAQAAHSTEELAEARGWGEAGHRGKTITPT